jgi:hypothetical protein
VSLVYTQTAGIVEEIRHSDRFNNSCGRPFSTAWPFTSPYAETMSHPAGCQRRTPQGVVQFHGIDLSGGISGINDGTIHRLTEKAGTGSSRFPGK